MGFGYGYNGGFENMIFGGAIMFFLGLFLIGAVIYLLVVTSRKHNGKVESNQQLVQSVVASSNLNDKAILILNDRFAKGEISEEEYLSRKSALLKDLG